MAVTAAADAGFVTDISGFEENVAREDGFRRSTPLRTYMRFAPGRGRGLAYDCNNERKRQDRAWQIPGNLLYYTTVSGYSYANWRVARGPSERAAICLRL